MRRRIDRLHREGVSALVEEGRHGFVVLGDEVHEIGPPVLVEADHRDMNGSLTRVHLAHLEARRRPGGGAVLEEKGRSHLAPAEGRDHQVQISVLVEIRGMGVGDPQQARSECLRLEAAVGPALQPDDVRVLSPCPGPRLPCGRDWGPWPRSRDQPGAARVSRAGSGRSTCRRRTLRDRAAASS